MCLLPATPSLTNVPPQIRLLLSALPLAVSLVWLFADAPVAVLREAWFVVLLTGATVLTRTITWRGAVFGLSLGIGVAAPLMVAVGWLLARGGLDVSDSVVGRWLVVPILRGGRQTRASTSAW